METKRRTKGEMCGWACVVVAAMFALGAACIFVSNVYIVSTSITVQGQVIDNREERWPGRFGENVQFYPVVKFEDAAGIAHSAESNGSLDAPLAIGTALPVYYRSQNPQAARVGGDAFWDPPLGCLAVGVVFLAWGTMLILLTRWIESRWPGLVKRY